MTISHINLVKFSAAAPGTGAITQGAVSGALSRLPAAGDDGKTFIIRIDNGSSFEVCQSVYTHSGTSWSRGTLRDSSTGSQINFTGAVTVLVGEDAAFFDSLATPDLSTVVLLAGRLTPQHWSFGTLPGASTGYQTSTSDPVKGSYGLTADLAILVDELNVQIVLPNSPTISTHLANKGYVDSGDSDNANSIADLAAITTDQTILTAKGSLFVRDATGVNELLASTNGFVLTLDSSQSLGVKWAAGGGAPFDNSVDLAKVTDSATNTITTVATFGHDTSGTPAVGFGLELKLQGQSDTTPDRDMASFEAHWSDPTDASRKAVAALNVWLAGTKVQAFSVTPNGTGVNIELVAASFLRASSNFNWSLGGFTNATFNFKADEDTGLGWFAANTCALVAGNVACVQVDDNATAAETRMLVYDVTAAALRRVSIGAADSGGAGFRLLRIPN